MHRCGRLLILGLLGGSMFLGTHAEAVAQRPFGFGRSSPKPEAPPPPKSALLSQDRWQGASRAPIAPGEIDKLIATDLQAENVTPAPRTTDEQFVRRVTLDLTGQLPVPADVTEFVADTKPDKRARVIDKLLASDEYARHWARYWRVVFTSRIMTPRDKLLAGVFEKWLTEQIQQNRGWGDIVRDMLTAEGSCNFDDDGTKGAIFFMASRLGADSVTERAAEASRIFLGIQIQCAQCHDHPSDQWKRVQFHEFAAFFVRANVAPVRDGMQQAGVSVGGPARGPTRQFAKDEHEMPSKEDPKQTLVVHPRFLDGKGPGPNRNDHDRRQFLANAIVDKENFWFAGAYVNRMWGEFMGQSFYQPIDDMGPQKEVVFANVLTRLSGAFRGNNYDTKDLFRAMLNTEAYQRQIRLGDAAEQHLHFAAVYPTRLHADALWESLVNVLGRLSDPRFAGRGPMQAGPYAGPQNFEGLFKEEFSFDPSAKADEVEGSISQALLMMNNPLLNGRIEARGTNLLGRVLTAYPDNDEALRMVYLRTLARKPTDREMDRSRAFVQKTNNRAEAFEDILWALLNSTEFQTKR